MAERSASPIAGFARRAHVPSASAFASRAAHRSRHPASRSPPSSRWDTACRYRVAARVLIVDDNRDAADSLAMLCESEGHTTRVAYSPAEALEAALPFIPDVALLDIVVAKAIRAQC
jgi:PleD family two-component response regulator